MCATKRAQGESKAKKSLWRGVLGFGLIDIPVSLVSLQLKHEPNSQLLDKRDHALIGYKRYNKNTGEEVPSEMIVRGYEHAPGEYVILPEERTKVFRADSVIELRGFVPLHGIDPIFYETPYGVHPSKNAEKGYCLLRDALEVEGKAALARVNLFRKTRWVVVLPRGGLLLLCTLRSDLDLSGVDSAIGFEKGLAGVRIAQKELNMARMLIQSRTATWNPASEKTRRALRVESKRRGVLARGKSIDLSPLLSESLKRERKNLGSKSRSGTQSSVH